MQTDPVPLYDAWLHWQTFSPCNFNCSYCTSTKHGLKPVDVPALMRTLRGTGRTFRVGFTGGGEPFLVPNIVETMAAISGEHFISFNSHLTNKKVRTLLERVDTSRILYVTASAHIEELLRLKLLDTFASNVHTCRERGVQTNVVAVAYPPLVAEVDKYRGLFGQRGLDLGFAPFVGTYQGRRYPAAYSSVERGVFGLTADAVGRHAQQGKPCNAGCNALAADPSGDVYPCINSMLPAAPHRKRLLLGNLFTGFRFEPGIIRCPYDVCVCPFNRYDRKLFKRAVEESIAGAGRAAGGLH